MGQLTLIPEPRRVLPLEPLVTLAGGYRRFRDTAACSSTVLRAWGDRGVPVDRADTLATRLGYHPVEVWGDQWLEVSC